MASRAASGRRTAIAASTAGTLQTSEFSRLQAYLFGYTAGALVLTLVLLPAVLAAFTPFRYREVFRAFQDPILTVFATGKVILAVDSAIFADEKAAAASAAQQTGNVFDRAGQTTYCSECGAVLIGRNWYELGEWGLDAQGRCTACGTACAGVFAARPGSWGSRRLPVRLANIELA